MFNKSFINTQFKCNILYGDKLSIEPIDLTTIEKVETVPAKSKYSLVHQKKYDLTDVSSDLDKHISVSMDELTEALPTYKVIFKIKSVLLNSKITTVDCVQFKCCINHETEHVWVDLLFSKQKAD